MAEIHINYNLYGTEKDHLIKEMIETFREICFRNLENIEGKFLFEYINQHNQFDLLEFPETEAKIFPMFAKIDSEYPNCFIAGLNYYKKHIIVICLRLPIFF